MATILAYNSLTRAKEPLQPLADAAIGMYLCGLTPYADCHIGHLLGPVVFDAVARWLTLRGFRVRLVNNITDIDDKIIERSREVGEPWQAFAERYTAQYLELQRRLHVVSVTDRPRCTGYIPQMVAYIDDLVRRDRAYQAADGVYYDIAKQPGYGKLSGRRPDEMLSGARIERDHGLRQPGDFALWKLAKPGEPSWPSPWGAGRPGWHIECSVMSHETLGATFDIHGGGDDLKFPHHENEIAQGEAHGGGYARLWMHNGMVQYHGAKVSKSDPRMRDPAFAIRFKALHLVDSHGPATIRFLMLLGHYRRPTEFGEKAIEDARAALGRLHRQLGALLEEPVRAGGPAELARIEAVALPAALALQRQGFIAQMDDDFNSGAAIAHLFTMQGLIRALPAGEQAAALAVLRDLGRAIGLFQPGDGRDTATALAASPRLQRLMGLVLELRQQARARRQFADSDRIRAALKEAGIAVKDEKKDGVETSSWELGGEEQAAIARTIRLIGELQASAHSAGDEAQAERIRQAVASDEQPGAG
jgi:cysteinyl-tRNA synthetase